MGLLRGKPLLAKLSTISVIVVLPSAMIASLIYSPPDFLYKSSSEADSPPPTISDRS